MGCAIAKRLRSPAHCARTAFDAALGRGMKTLADHLGSVRCSSGLRFQLAASKPSPLFQRVKVMAAILRASVRRAISGFMPLASKAA